MTSINLIVLNCKNLEESIAFYEALGLKFQEEQHGKSPVHYSCQLEKVLLELYPTQEEVNRNTKLGFRVDNIDEILTKLPKYVYNQKRDTQYGPMAILKDPDGMWILLSER